MSDLMNPEILSIDKFAAILKEMRQAMKNKNVHYAVTCGAQLHEYYRALLGELAALRKQKEAPLYNDEITPAQYAEFVDNMTPEEKQGIAKMRAEFEWMRMAQDATVIRAWLTRDAPLDAKEFYLDDDYKDGSSYSVFVGEGKPNKNYDPDICGRDGVSFFWEGVWEGSNQCHCLMSEPVESFHKLFPLRLPEGGGPVEVELVVRGRKERGRE